MTTRLPEIAQIRARQVASVVFPSFGCDEVIRMVRGAGLLCEIRMLV